MSFEIRHPGRQLVFASLFLSATAVYLVLVSAQFVAAQFAGTLRPRALHWAIGLDPGNAEYRDELAQFELRARETPGAALRWSQSAIALDPNNNRYWLHQAMAQEGLGDFSAERNSLIQASFHEPHSAGLAWDVANLLLAQGDTQDALPEYRKVMENDPPRTLSAIEICWRIDPDADFLLQNVLPENVDKAFLSFLISKNEPDAAAKAWSRIVELQQPVEHAFLFEYLRYLFANHQPEQAARVWQESTNLSDLAAYQPSEENLIVNGNFSLDILNGGFDWRYQKTPAVTLALDPIETHAGSKSLRISFEGPGIVDAGIREIVSVEPETQYEFSAFYRAEEMDGAGGPRFAIQDLYSEETFFMSDDLRNAEFWTPVNSTFTTGPDTHLIVLRIARVPGASPIRGELWIDDLKLVTADHEASLKKEQP
ncbi:MAG TPA: hypothetical protein VLW06_08310 [Terriglobales bacterium]|nr:hypothetical protein [Terriglobales bacterium]